MVGRDRKGKTVESVYESQLLILQVLYKFRFGTNELIAQYRGVSRRAINDSLLRLVEHKLITRRYTNKSKIRGESAVYYLTSQGIKHLKARFKLAETIVNAIYKNSIVSDQFIAHNLAVFSSYITLNGEYKKTYDIFTKAELTTFKQYPEQLPDLFLASKDGKRDFMLNLYLNEPFFVIKKHIKYYIEHRNEEWPDKTPYPSVLLVCPDDRNEVKAIKYSESQLEDFDFYVTTVKALLSGTKEIWTNPVEPEKLVTL